MIRIWYEKFKEIIATYMYGKGMAIFIGLFLYQYVTLFDHFELSTVRQVTAITMLFTGISLLLFRHLWLNLLLSILASLYINYRFIQSSLDWNERDELTLNRVASSIDVGRDFLDKTHPTFLITLCISFLFIFLHRIIITKGRLLAFLIISVLLFSILDSYSLFVLWDEVAVMIGCGLLMLAILHFRFIKETHPEGHKFLLHSPFPTILTMLCVIFISLYLGILAPNIKPILMDPYTAWQTSQGKAVNISVMGSEVTEQLSIEESQLSPDAENGVQTELFEQLGMEEIPYELNSSGYGRDELSLGQGFTEDPTPVFTVSTTQPNYWRGETRTIYTGDGWENDRSETSSPSELIESTSLNIESSQVTGLTMVEVQQTFRMLTEQPYPVFFAATYAHAVKQTGIEGETFDLNRVSLNNEQQTIYWNGSDDAPYPKVYSIISKVPVIDGAKLRTSPSVSDPERMSKYLQLPVDLPSRVIALARDITAQATNPFDQAIAIRNYLSSNYPYTIEPDLSKRTSPDFVDSFLFEIQAGYCDHYSTAMVVMARSLGIPARWVKGYVTGELNVDPELATNFAQLPEDINRLDSNSQIYTVRNSNAHSWVEIYFEGYGWIPFEPTAGFAWPDVQVPNEQQEQNTEEPPPDVIEDTERNSWGLWAWLSLFFILILTGTLYIYWQLQALDKISVSNLHHSVNYNYKFQKDIERLLKHLKRKGLRHDHHETLREMMLRWMMQYQEFSHDLEQLLLIFEKARYSGKFITKEEYELAQISIAKLRDHLKSST
jgi:transglutaminase-like putative cysteine protease